MELASLHVLMLLSRLYVICEYDFTLMLGYDWFITVIKQLEGCVFALLFVKDRFTIDPNVNFFWYNGLEGVFKET